jgi:hypothetical protein
MQQFCFPDLSAQLRGRQAKHTKDMAESAKGAPANDAALLFTIE